MDNIHRWYVKLPLIILSFFFIFFSLQPQAISSGDASNTSPEKLNNVAKAILQWDENNPGELFQKVKEANPDKNAIDSMRELNKALSDGILPAEITSKTLDIKSKQNAAQKSVRKHVLEVRKTMLRDYINNNPEKARSLYGIGDIGSWATKENPDASMDIDWSIFGVDPDVTADARDTYIKQLTADLDRNNSGMTLQDFDVVVTAEGHEREAGVFETEGGIDWAKRNMKSFTVLQPDGRMRTYNLEKKIIIDESSGKVMTLNVADPVGEMAMAAQMAKIRKAATEGGDYDKLFDDRGFLRTDVFADPDNAAEANALWDKYGEMLNLANVDYYKTRTETATGGALDMSKHLNEEVLTKKFDPEARMRKTLKYLYRADNITNKGDARLRKAIAADPLLSDPAYQKAIALSYEVTQHPDTVGEVLVREYGSTPDAALQQLGETSKKAILRMAEVSYQVEMDRIIKEIPTSDGRKAAMEKLTNDFQIIADEGGEYSDLAKSAMESIAKVQEVNDKGALEDIRKQWNTLEEIHNEDAGVTQKTLEYLNQTDLGRKMLEHGGRFLEWGSQNVYEKATGKFKSASVDFIGDLVDSTRTKGLLVVDIAGSAAMWVDVVKSVRNAKSDADLAYALGKTLVDNTFFGMILSTGYAGIVQGDNEALAKAIMYMLVPETALPALVASLGESAVTLGSQMVFESQLDALYLNSTCGEDGTISDFCDTGKTGKNAALELIDEFLGPGGYALAEDMIKSATATETGKGVNVFMKTAVVKAMETTLMKGNPLLFSEDGALMNACANIRKTTEEIDYLAKTFGKEMHYEAAVNGPWASGLDKGQTAALNTLIKQRNIFRSQAKEAMAEAIVRTFNERCRSENQLSEGKDEAMALLMKCQELFKRLGIEEKGMHSLDAEGAPYNLFTRWTTSDEVKQRTAMIALQKFLDAYKNIEEVRTAAENLAARTLGAGRKLSPRPLTGSLPLTTSPDRDMEIAHAYLKDMTDVGASCIKSLEARKKGELNSEYDQNTLRTLYAYRVRNVYWKSYRKAAAIAKELHWKTEIFDRVALDSESEKASEEEKILEEKEKRLLEEFEKHYNLDGRLALSLEAPKEIISGEDAVLKAIVTLDGDTNLSPEIAGLITYNWKQGKADLGGHNEASRTFRLDTPGRHNFSVIVYRATRKAGKETQLKVDEASVTITVTQAETEGEKVNEPQQETEKIESSDKKDNQSKKSEKASDADQEKARDNELNKDKADAGFTEAEKEAEQKEVKTDKNLKVSISGPTEVIEVGTMANVTASVSGGVPPYSYQWSGAGGYGAAASLTPASVGDRSVSVKVSDGDGYTVEETFIVRVGPGKVKMEGLKGDVFYGETTSLNAWGMGLKESEPPPDAKPAKSGVDCARNPNSPFCVETTHGGLIDNTKTGDSKTDKSSDWTIREVTSENAEKVYIPDPGSEDDYDMPPEEEKKESEYEVVWQSEPAVTFDPPTSTDGWTKITYDRADEIKVWCEMHKMIDGTFQTVGECEQQTVMVKPPAFSISFSPENGEAHVGQKVIATIHASPGVNADLIDYRWLDPPTSNRLELEKNSSRIELTVKDINPIKLNVIARVPVHGDELGEIKSSYTGVSYSVNAWMVQPPNRPQVWDPKKGGLKTLERNQRLTGEMITLKAEVQGNNVPDVLWDWQVNDGTSLSLSTSQTPTVSRSQAGNIIAKVIARDKNKRTLGVAEVTVSVMEPVPVPAGKNDQSDQQQAKQKQNEEAQNKAAKKKVENAQKMLDESKQLAHKGKFDEAIEKAQEAQKDDPQNKDIEKTLDETKKKKERIDEGIKQVKNLIAESEFNKAQEILIKQKNEAAYYPPVQEVEETLRAKWQEHIAKVNAAFGGIKVKSENRDYKEALEAVYEARKSLKLAPSELKTLADQEAFLKPLVAKKEKASGLFQSSKSKFESGDYDGCIKDYLEGHNLTKNMWNVNKDKTINSAQEIYLEALKKKKENEASAAASKQTGQINSSKAKSLNPVKKAATSVFIKNNTDSMGIPKSSFEPGEEIVLDFTASPDYPEKSWIGMFKADLPHSGMAANNNHELSFKYLEKKQKDTFTFTSPTEEGEYDFRMFDRNSEKEVATLKFTISVDGDAASLLLPKKVFEPGEEIALKFTASPNYPEKSWIGMFKADLPHTGMAENNNHELSFQYLEKKQKGIFTFTSPTEEGEYDFRMFERSNGKEVATIKFSVVVDKDAAGLILPKKVFEPGEEIALKFTASPNYPEKSWIGMFKADLPHSGMAENNNHELSFQYLEKKQNGTFEFTSPTEEGTYDFRMFEKSNGKEVATIKFKVNK